VSGSRTTAGIRVVDGVGRIPGFANSYTYREGEESYLTVQRRVAPGGEGNDSLPPLGRRDRVPSGPLKSQLIRSPRSVDRTVAYDPGEVKERSRSSPLGYGIRPCGGYHRSGASSRNPRIGRGSPRPCRRPLPCSDRSRLTGLRRAPSRRPPWADS